MAPPTGQVPAVAAAAAPNANPTAQQRARLEVVRPPRRVRSGLIGTVVICLTFATLFVLAAMQAVLVAGQLRLDRAHSAIAERQASIDKLMTEVAELEAPDRIQAEAVEFGLVQPPEVVFLAPGNAPVLAPTTTVAPG